MKNKNLAHKISLIGAFCCCAVAVVFLVNQRINSVSAETAMLSNTSATQLQPIDGVCSEINGTKSATMPRENLCKSGTPSAVLEKIIYSSAGWAWKCSGINGGANSYCNVIKYVADTVVSEPVNINTSTTSGVISPTITQESTTSSPAASSYTTSESVTRKTVETTSTDAIKASNSETTNSVSTSSSQDVTVKTEDKIVTEELSSSQSKPIVTDENLIPKEQITVSSYSQVESVEKSIIVKPPVVVQAKNLSVESNPKISGIVSTSLRVEAVGLNKKEDGKNNVELSGKSEPDALVTIYIFSEDPIVITVKADANGNWNYELDRDLYDGQHEAYVAVTDNAGKIISKSEPIAFVKTAQAATMIPLSELTANQSPVERASQQYILMAIVIMSIFLALALVSIGFLTHKRNLDERVD